MFFVFLYQKFHENMISLCNEYASEWLFMVKSVFEAFLYYTRDLLDLLGNGTD